MVALRVDCFQRRSFRMGSTSARTIAFDLAYAPFGETYATSGTTDIAFTAQRQDTSTGLYDFLWREYSIQGRWSSPDPAGVGAVDSTNPQSWNRYAYVLNNPLNSVDPLGLCNPGANGIWTDTGYIIAGTSNDSDNLPCTTFQPWLTNPDFQCYFFNSCGSGSSGGGGGGSVGGGATSGTGIPTSKSASNAACAAPSLLPHSLAIVAGGEGTVGVAAAGASASASGGIWGSTTGAMGLFATASAFANFGQRYEMSPPNGRCRAPLGALV
jgi:RHS repeat-associated protein